ncbi:MAG: DNA-binding protein [Clostridiales bacterium]|nr:DNA-binding protein [Clostridiales bacterium]
MEKHVELSCLLGYYGPMLTERQLMLMEQHLGEDCSLAEIAEREGISRQGVRDALKRAEEQLYELEEKLGTMKRSLRLEKGLSALREQLEALPLSEAEKQPLQATINELYDMIEE